LFALAPLQRDDSGKLMNRRIVGRAVKETPRDRLCSVEITFTQRRERYAQFRLLVLSRTHRALAIMSTPSTL
jgi:hypothetical protein